ncbi:MAG: hypothetical protein QMD36_04945 [Candidatus Aenigmarchaeota archaeon]|nr:hypothetical protein [Candidatus Aenigmarchaeota archaeon]
MIFKHKLKNEEEYNIGIEISPYDRGNVAYGKFCFMRRTFKDHLRKSSRLLYGNDVREILSQAFPEGEEVFVAYSLWITRKNLISLKERITQEKLKSSTKECIRSFKNFLREFVLSKLVVWKESQTQKF